MQLFTFKAELAQEELLELYDESDSRTVLAILLHSALDSIVR